MKKELLLLFLFICSTFIKAQSNKFGIINGNVSVDFAMHYTSLEKSGITAYPLTVAGPAVRSFPVEVNFGLVKPLSAGLNYSYCRWVTGRGISGKFSQVGININLYIANAKRFNMQLALTPSIVKFKPVDFVYDQNNYLSLQLKGTSFKTRLLFNFYFSDYAGMNFGIGYSSYQIGIKNYAVKVSDPELEKELNNIASQNFKLTISGVSVCIGVIIKVDLFPKKKKTEE